MSKGANIILDSIADDAQRMRAHGSAEALRSFAQRLRDGAGPRTIAREIAEARDRAALAHDNAPNDRDARALLLLWQRAATAMPLGNLKPVPLAICRANGRKAAARPGHMAELGRKSGEARRASRAGVA